MTTLKLAVVNALTASRLVAALAVVWLVYNLCWLPAAILLLSGFATDLLDGNLARKWQVVTKWGGKCDEVFDRLLLLAPILAMALSAQIPVALGFVLILGIPATDVLAESFGIMRLVWWPLCYGTVVFGFVTNISPMITIIPLSLLMVAFTAVALAKPEEVHKAMATIKPASDNATS